MHRIKRHLHALARDLDQLTSDPLFVLLMAWWACTPCPCCWCH